MTARGAWPALPIDKGHRDEGHVACARGTQLLAALGPRETSGVAFCRGWRKGTNETDDLRRHSTRDARRPLRGAGARGNGVSAGPAFSATGPATGARYMAKQTVGGRRVGLSEDSFPDRVSWESVGCCSAGTSCPIGHYLACNHHHCRSDRWTIRLEIVHYRRMVAGRCERRRLRSCSAIQRRR